MWDGKEETMTGPFYAPLNLSGSGLFLTLYRLVVAFYIYVVCIGTIVDFRLEKKKKKKNVQCVQGASRGRGEKCRVGADERYHRKPHAFLQIYFFSSSYSDAYR